MACFSATDLILSANRDLSGKLSEFSSVIPRWALNLYVVVCQFLHFKRGAIICPSSGVNLNAGPVPLSLLGAVTPVYSKSRRPIGVIFLVTQHL